MEVEAGSLANCTTEYFSPSVGSVAELSIVPKSAPNNVEDEVDSGSNTPNEKTEGNVLSCAPDTARDATKDAEERKLQDDTSRPSLVPAVNAKNNVGKYRLLRTIGKGNFAKVKLAIHMATGVEVAIKIINKTVMDSTLLKRLKREITIMKVTNHPNIVRLLEIIENEDVLCLVMEYASGGEIFDYLVANGKMREKEARVKFRQLLSAIQYCHSKRIVHRDLKAENILLDRNLNVKVADFGLANNFDYDQRLTTFCGSPPYAAPELFLGIPYYGPGVDVWSLGVILFTLVLGHLPFDARDLRELRSKILGLHYSIPKGAVSTECEALLRKMLVLDPKDRSSLKVLMQDKWINAGYAPNEQLRPYKEPPKSQLDEVRVKAMEAMGFTRADLESSVVNPEFDHVYATYHLLPETPSQFMALCEELSHGHGQSQGTMPLPNSLTGSQTQPVPVPPAPTTAIGRFTVEPSIHSTETTTRPSVVPLMVGVPSLDSPSSAVPRKQLPYPMADAPSREHHSLTSALPVALRKAIVQMGKTFGGGTYTSVTPTSGSSTGNDMNQRTINSTGGRGSAKFIKQNGGRSAVTTAPVPMGSAKKSNHTAGPSSKRSSPGGQIPLSTTSSGRSCSIESNSAVRPIPVLSNVTPGATPQPSPSLVADRTSKRSPITVSPRQSTESRRCSPPTHGKLQATSHKKSPNNTVVENRITSSVTKDVRNDSPRDSLRVASVSNTGPTSKPCVGGSSASSESYGDLEIRETAAAIVQDVWRSMGRPVTETTSTQPVAIPGTSNIGFAQDTDDVKSETKDPQIHEDSPSVSVISQGSPSVDTGQRLSTGAWSADAEKDLKIPKVLHTVQGTEAVTLREEAMCLKQEGTVPSVSNTRDSSGIPLDPNHQNTWSKGVLKALGGFFTPSKPHDHANTNVAFLAKPREVRFPWSVHTTSTKSAEEVLQSIIEALEVTPGCRYAYDTHLPFLVRCSWAADRPALRPDTSVASDTAKPPPMPSLVPGGLREDPVHWEMEVCQLPRLHLRGVRLKRIRGCALHFRPIADLVMKSLRL